MIHGECKLARAEQSTHERTYASVSLTDTRRESPGSSMVTPYSTSAASMVFRLWVITTNWVWEHSSRNTRRKRWMLASSSGASTSSSTQNDANIHRFLRVLRQL